MDKMTEYFPDKEERQLNIPTLKDLSTIMKQYSNILYMAWRSELALQIMNLEFEGYFSRNNIKVCDPVWRLPNNYIREALSLLEFELDDLGYSCSFKFGDIEDKNWILYYKIELPDREEDFEDPIDEIKCETMESLETN